MVRYLKLVLDGYGCFAGRKEFLFSGGIDTMSLPNEAGKSMMLNGLVHTIFGMDKKAKDRFRPWDGAALSRGELTLESDGARYVIRMDFAGDKVEVLIEEKLTGLLSERIRRQGHVPGGKRSQAYMEFLSEALGTADEDAFRAAYVIAQPISGEFALGAGRDLLTKQGSTQLDKAIKELLGQLGKAPEGITRYLENYDSESSRQQNDRRLEQLRGKMDDIRARLSRALSKLDEIQPSKQELAEAKQALEAALTALKSGDDRRERILKWARLREECRIKQKEAADATNYLNAVKDEASSLETLRLKHAEHLGNEPKKAYEEHLIASLERTASDVEAILIASEEASNKAAIKAATGLPSGRELLSPDAESLLKKAEEDARRRAAELNKVMDASSEWERRFSEVSGMGEDERRKLDQVIRKASEPVGRAAAGMKWAAALAALLGLASIAGGLILHLSWLAMAGVGALGFAAVLMFIASKGNGRKAAESFEARAEAAEARRIADLYDSMMATARPVVPGDASAQLEELDKISKCADSLTRVALKVRSRLDAVTVEQLEALTDLSGGDASLGMEGILGRGDAFWGAARRENANRALSAEALVKSAAEVAKAENAVAKMLSAKGFESMEKLKDDTSLKMVEAASARSEWLRGFEDDLILRPDLTEEVLRAADGELKGLDEMQAQREQDVESLKLRVRGLEDELRQADAESLSNIPELEDELEGLQEEEECMLFEADALAEAIRALRMADASFSTGARVALEQKATALLQEITEVGIRQVAVGEDFALDVRREGSSISAEQLSQGTRDQLYISMRLAAASVLEDGRKVPIFMDDSFGTTDRGRLARIKLMLERYASERQFIVLSHSEDISGWGNPIAGV